VRVARGPRSESIHRFTRSAVGHFAVASASSTTGYFSQGDTWSFSLAAGLTSSLGKFIDSPPDVTSTVANIAIPNVSEFTALFDLYRVRSVRVRLLPLYQTGAEPLSTARGSATMWYSLNEKNAGAIMSLTDLLQREDVKIAQLSANEFIEFDYKPRPVLDANSAGTATSGVSDMNPWLSTGSLDVASLSGIRVYFDAGNPSTTTTSQVVLMFLSFDLEFKTVQ